MDLGFRMHAERTPNPDSVKWVLSSEVAPGGAYVAFHSAEDAAVSVLARSLFEVDGVTQVFLGRDFITVTKEPETDWADLAEPVVGRIKAWAESGEPALEPGYSPAAVHSDDPTVGRIVEILERDIRPYVAQDGGEIAFAGFDEGVVSVYLRGACAGCPSSTVTLKMGIEARLKEEIPEVKSVVAV